MENNKIKIQTNLNNNNCLGLTVNSVTGCMQSANLLAQSMYTYLNVHSVQSVNDVLNHAN